MSQETGKDRSNSLMVGITALSLLAASPAAADSASDDARDAALFRSQLATTRALAGGEAGQAAINHLTKNALLLVRSATRKDLTDELKEYVVPECFAYRMQLVENGQSTQFIATNAHCLDGTPKFIKVIGPELDRSAQKWRFNLRSQEAAMLNIAEDCRRHPEYQKSAGMNKYDLAICAVQRVEGRAMLPDTKGLPLDSRPLVPGTRLTYLTGEITPEIHYATRWTQADTFDPAIRYTNKVTGWFAGGSHDPGESGKAVTDVVVNADRTVQVNVRGVFKQAVLGSPFATLETADDLAKFVRENREWLQTALARDPNRTVILNWKTKK